MISADGSGPGEIVVGDPRGDHLAIVMIRRLRSGKADYWDGNWVAADVVVRAGGFAGATRADLHLSEFETFRREVAELHRSGRGAARYEAMEGQLRLEFRRGSTGPVEVEPGRIAALLGSLDGLFLAFPIVGRPEA